MTLSLGETCTQVMHPLGALGGGLGKALKGWADVVLGACRTLVRYMLYKVVPGCNGREVGYNRKQCYYEHNTRRL